MKYCTRCVLPETFPGIHFNDDGVCQYCLQMPDAEQRAAQKARLRTRFEKLVERVRGQPGYHCLMAWSGGKDSTYTLWLLREQYHLNVLTYTFDNGFVSGVALKNMRAVAENLGVDHLTVKPRFDTLRRIFLASMDLDLYPPRALERASGICNSCMALAKGIGLQLALERAIPIIAYGWSPGQIPLASAFFHFNRQMLQAFLQVAIAPLLKIANDEIAVYFPDQALLDRSVDFPYNVSPLAFLEYDEQVAFDRIKTLAWEAPQDTDPNSTNCLLNSFANLVHVEQMGYHPYAMELASLVREGYMSREEALDRLAAAPMPEVVAAVQAKLGVIHSDHRSRAR